MSIAETTALELLQYGIRNSDEYHLPNNDIAWNDVFAFSDLHGISALALDGLDRCVNQNQKVNVDFQTKMEWIGRVQQIEVLYAQHQKTIINLAKFYHHHGIKMMLMKGVGLSLNYPKPNHRPCGDIDIYLYGDIEKADKLLKKYHGIAINHDQHKHTVFQFEGLTVENHYDFANYHKHRSSKKLDRWLKEDANANCNANFDLGENVYLPSANFNAVFLIRHAASHFAADELTLRHLLDWAFFVENHYDEVDWEWHWKICHEQNMHQFLLAINEICVKYLGFDASKFRIGGNSLLTEKVYEDIIHTSSSNVSSYGMMPYIIDRGLRWWKNRWKHRIVYPESISTTFISQIFAHLMKPATLKG